MKRILTTGVAVLVASILAACGGPTSGTVVEAEYDDPDRYTSTCYRTEYRTVTKPVTRTSTVNGKSTTTTRMETQRESYQVPFSCTQYDGEHYKLRLRSGDEDGWLEVSASAFRGCRVGDFYSDKAGVCRGQ